MAEFTDAALTARARNMALWLCDAANANLSRRSREASVDFLLRELPDHWTGDDLTRMAREVRQQVGARASARAWLSAMGWLVGEDERLPARHPFGMSAMARHAAQRVLADTLAVVTGKANGHRR